MKSTEYNAFRLAGHFLVFLVGSDFAHLHTGADICLSFAFRLAGRHFLAFLSVAILPVCTPELIFAFRLPFVWPADFFSILAGGDFARVR